jgi:purine-cytosine permease-like protein
MNEQRSADQVWAVELQGIEPVSDQDRHGTPFELFWIWFAANIGILGIVDGAILRTLFGLNLWQSALVAFTGSAGSFLLVGALSVAGKWGGAPGLTLSRAPFGVRGNLGPTLLSWISLVGWETISVITAAYALLGLFGILGLPSNSIWTIVSLILIALLVVGAGLLGHATLVWIQRAATWIFGLLTVVIVIFLIGKTNWSEIIGARPGPWGSGVLAAFSFIVAATGISWINAGADYARYLPRHFRARGIIFWTTFGSTVPLFVLIMAGVLLSTQVEGLASSGNPLLDIEKALPSWMAVPYLLTAIGGLIVAADLAIYSSGLNLLAMGLKVARYKTVILDGIIMIAGSVLVLLVAQNFFGPFVSFVQLLADGLAAWSAVFLVDMLLRRGYDTEGLMKGGQRSVYYYTRGIHLPAGIAWVLGILVGLAFTTSPWFIGPFARGVFAQSSLGYILGFIAAGLTYWLLVRWGGGFLRSKSPELIPARKEGSPTGRDQS